MLKLNKEGIKDRERWAAAGIRLPAFDYDRMVAATEKSPEWVHFGAGNIFRGFVAAAHQELLNSGGAQTGIIAAETFDDEIIEKIYKPHDNMSLVVSVLPDGKYDMEVVASVARGMTLGGGGLADLKQLFTQPTLKMASFTVTEKGYSLVDTKGQLLVVVQEDMAAGPEKPRHLVSVVAAVMHERYKAGALPMALLSMDNCSHNGDILKNAVLRVAGAWEQSGLAQSGFTAYLSDETKVSFPWSMIDKITPRPSEDLKADLEKLGFEDTGILVTKKGTHIAPFVNAESTRYLFIENNFPNGALPLSDAAGVWFTDRQTVDKVETMKVTTCLNPLHTAISSFGTMLGIEYVNRAIKDKDLKKLVHRLGYEEGLPVVVDPGIIRPRDFLDEVLQKRFSNPFVPDTTWRIMTDTSMKVGVRYGQTIKKYLADDPQALDSLVALPLSIAAWCRYLLGVDDRGKPIPLSDDPRMDELKKALEGISLGLENADITAILSREEIFGTDLTKTVLGGKISKYFNEMIAGPGAVRSTLEKYINGA